MTNAFTKGAVAHNFPDAVRPHLMSESPVAQKGKAPGQHYGSPLNAVHGPAPEKPGAVKYECADCQDLYERLQKVFREMGHEF